MHRVFSAALGLLIAASVLDAAAQPPANLGGKRAARSQTPASQLVSTEVSRSPRGLLPGTTANVVTTIQGNALNSVNAGLPHATVRLRDARFGRIIDTTITDKTGFFTFRVYDPGSYVIELVGNDQTILAASQILNVGAGDTVSAVVKLPFRVPPFAGVLGHSTASVLAVASAAAASGVLARAVTGEPVSPQR
jgi:hypothetical protein